MARAKAGFGVLPATVYRFGRTQIGHILDTGVADLTFPREIHDELSLMAERSRTGLDSRAS